MKQNEFRLQIALGNDAMRSPRDVAKALRAIAKRIEDGVDSGGVRDLNGNTVGQFEFRR